MRKPASICLWLFGVTGLVLLLGVTIEPAQPYATADESVLEASVPAADSTLIDAELRPLYDLLDSPRAEDRANGAVRLSGLGEAALPALPKMISLLSDEGPHVQVGNISRSVAAHVESALPKLGSRAVGPLIDALIDPDSRVRSRVATVLGNIQDARAIEPLIHALADTENNVRSQAGSALKNFGPKVVLPLIDALDAKEVNVRTMAMNVLGEFRDERAIAPLAKLLGHDDELLRQWAIYALRKFGPAALHELIVALQSDNVHIKRDGKLRSQIVTTLGMIQHRDSVEPLLVALSDEHDEVRSAAAFSLGSQISHTRLVGRLVERLITALSDQSPTVRRSAAGSLGGLAHYHTDADRERIIEVLIEALADSSDDVRQSTIEGLGNWRAQQAVDSLLDLLENDQLRSFAAFSLGQIGDSRAIEPVRRYLVAKDCRVISALGLLRDRESVEAIIGLLADNDKRIQCAAAGALGAIRDRRAVEPLIAALKGDEQLGRGAARALGKIQDPRAVRPLIDFGRQYADEHQFGFRRQLDADPSSNPVAWPLVGMGLPAIEPLAAVLNDPSTSLREVAAWVLYNLMSQGGADAEDMQPAIESLVEALDDSSAVVRNHAAMTLGSLKDPRAATALLDVVRAADQSSFVYVNAASYLGTIRDPKSFEPLVALLRDDRPRIRSSAVRGLGLLGDAQALEPLLATLRDSNPQVRAKTADALANLEATGTADSLLALLCDEDADVRSAVTKALGRLREPRALEPLAKAASDEHFDVGVAAGIALVRLDDPRGVVTLRECLTSSNRKWREEAATAIALSHLKNEVLVPPLVSALDDPDILVRLYAAGALGTIGNDAAVDALLHKTTDRENLRAILQALGATKKDRALAALLRHLNDADAEIRGIAADQIGRFEDGRNDDRLIEHLADPSPDVRLAVIRALTMLKSVSAIGPLTAALEDDDPRVRVYAARGLKRIQK